MKPFAHESYKAWENYISSLGYTCASVVKDTSGRYATVGNPADGIEGFTKIKVTEEGNL